MADGAMLPKYMLENRIPLTACYPTCYRQLRRLDSSFFDFF